MDANTVSDKLRVVLHRFTVLLIVTLFIPNFPEVKFIILLYSAIIVILVDIVLRFVLTKKIWEMELGKLPKLYWMLRWGDYWLKIGSPYLWLILLVIYVHLHPFYFIIAAVLWGIVAVRNFQRMRREDNNLTSST